MDGRADGEQSPIASWADDEHVDESAKPETLLHLIKNGVRFEFAKPWSETERPRLVKNLSVYFSVYASVTSENILQAFDDAGIDINEITSIQRRTSNRTWVVSFDSQLEKETALEVASIQIGGSTVFLGDCENRLVLVKIYEAPRELPDTTVIGCLSYYGRVLSFRRDRVPSLTEDTDVLNIHCDLTSTSLVYGEESDIIYSFGTSTLRASYGFVLEPRRVIFNSIKQ